MPGTSAPSRVWVVLMSPVVGQGHPDTTPCYKTWLATLSTIALLIGGITGTVITVLNHLDKDPGTGYGGEKCEINDTCFSKSCDFDAGRCFCKIDDDCKLDSEECSNDSSCVPFTLMPTTTPSSQPSAAPTCSISLEVGDNELLAKDASRNSHFGSSVAMDGNTAVIGVYNNESAYVFDSNDSEWTQMKKLTPPDEVSLSFGTSVAIDEGMAIVGASGAGKINGAAYIYSNIGINNWVFQEKLMASEPRNDDSDIASVEDNFGGSVALDGNTVIIGARGGGNDVGAVYVYVRNESKWEFQQRIGDIGAGVGNRFGTSVALDGDTAIIGADNAAFIFTREGSMWTRQQKLDLVLDESSNDNFGDHVALDTDIAVVGAEGSAFVYVRFGSEWKLRQKLLAIDVGISFEYPSASIVAIEGTTIVLTFPEYGVANYAYIYTRTGYGSKWTVAANLTANDLGKYDEFGSSVALSGSTLMIGAPGLPGGDSSQGAVYTMDYVDCYPSL